MSAAILEANTAQSAFYARHDPTAPAYPDSEDLNESEAPMPTIQTPEQIADSVISARPGFWRERSASEQIIIRHDLLVAAINTDRAQFFDTSGSASSQHFIETGRYLLHEEVAEMEAINNSAPTPEEECRHCGEDVVPMPNPDTGDDDWQHANGLWACHDFENFAEVNA